jgi:hypothetical protein
MNMFHDFGRYEPVYNSTPPPWWWMMQMQQQPQKTGGKKGKKSYMGKRPTLSELLKEAIDNRDALDTVIEKLAKKDKKDDGGKKDDKKGTMFSVWDTMLLLTVLALPCSILQLGIAKAVLFGIKLLANN